MLLNCCGVNGLNAHEYYDPRKSSRFLKGLDNVVVTKPSTTLVGTYFTRQDFESLCKTMLIDPVKLEDVYTEISRMPCAKFYLGNDASRVVSWPERHTTTAPDGSLRPSVFTGVTYKFDAKQWLKFMKNVPLSPLSELLHAKYEAFPKKWDVITVEVQLLHLMAYEAVACGLVAEAAIEQSMSDEELCAEFRFADADTRNARLLDLIVGRYSAFRDVLFLNEANGELCEKLKEKLSAEFELVVPPTYEPSSKQNSVLFLRKTKFAVVCNIDSTVMVDAAKKMDAPIPTRKSWCACVVKMLDGDGVELVLVSAHASSTGDDARTYARFCSDLIPPTRLLCGMDSNIPCKESRQLFENSCDVTFDLGTTACNEPTVLRKRTSLVVQKHATLSSRPVEKYCDLYVHSQWTVDCTDACVDNTGICEFQDVVFPNVWWPSDHAAVHARWFIS
jgi:hypothetical protein